MVSLFPTLPPHSEVKGSLKTLPLGHLVSLGKMWHRCQSLGPCSLVLLVKAEDTLTGRGGVVLIHRGWDVNVDPWVGSQPRFQSPKCFTDMVYYYSVHHGTQMAPGEMEPLPV